MTIEKLKSGSYRITQMADGVRYRVTVDHKPSKVEALRLITEEIESSGKPSRTADSTLADACESYIAAKSNILSPSTIRGYRSIMRRISPSLMSRHIADITRLMVQNEVNTYASSHSPKSTSNLCGFILTVLKFHGAGISDIALPQKVRADVYIPTKEDVQRIFEALKGSKYEVPIMLAALGLRRSEICALELSDLSDDDVLTINKAKVENERKEWVIKTTKTTDSARTVSIPPYLAELIRDQGYIYDGHPELIYRTLTDTQKKLGIPHFQLHKLRHFFASYMHQSGFTDKQIQAAGGWKTDNILKNVYQHAMEIDEAKKNMADKIGGLIT